MYICIFVAQKIKVVALEVRFPNHLESTHLDTRAKSYAQNTNAVQIEFGIRPTRSKTDFLDFSSSNPLLFHLKFIKTHQSRYHSNNNANYSLNNP